MWGTLSDRLMRLLGEVPSAEFVAVELIDAAFAPRVIAKQLGCILALQTLALAGKALFLGCKYGFVRLTGRAKARRSLEAKLKSASTYAEFVAAANELDNIDGYDRWRDDDASPLVNSRALRRRTQELRALMRNRDVFHLIFRLRSGLARDKYGTLHPGLHSVARGGTKKVIEEYHAAVRDALNFICDSSSEGDETEITWDVKLAFFNETRHSYGRTALLLSGGASLGFYHIGLAKCLYEEGLLPRVISGASAGSLMAAMLGTRTEDEILHLINAGSFRKDFFRLLVQTKENDSIASRLQYLLPSALRFLGDKLFGLILDRRSVLQLDTDHLKNVVIENVGVATFQEAFDRTGRIINIIVAPLNLFDPPRLLNYLTTPHVCIWSAVVASCAIPGVFDSCVLIVKEPDGSYRSEYETEFFGAEMEPAQDRRAAEPEKYSDGSIERDLPMQQLSELFNVNHFIVSQVNPHSFLLTSLGIDVDVWTPAAFGFMLGYLRFLKAQCRDWLRNVIDLAMYRSLSPEWGTRRGFSQILTQEYEGRRNDVNVKPWEDALSVGRAFFSLISNPSTEEYKVMLAVSQRNTWPHVSKIRAHCMVEMTLDQCVQRLRRRVSAENRLTAKDRTPSFHTTRSIINLGSLSVVDPTPIDNAAADSQEHTEGGGGMGIKKTTSMASFYYSREKSSTESMASGTSSPKSSLP